MLLRALQALWQRDWVRAIPGAVLACVLISIGMFLGAVLTSAAGASPLTGPTLDADWSKIATLLAGLVGLYVAVEKRLTTLGESAKTQASEMREWAGSQFADLRVHLARIETIQDTHGKRLDRAEGAR